MAGDGVSVVIVTWNSRPMLDRCLTSLEPELSSTGAKLVLVDNGSRDGSADHAARAVPQAVVIRNPRNRGFAAACNQGAGAASGGLLAFLNPDVLVDSGSLDALRRTLARHPEAGLVAARLRSPDGAFQPSCRRFPLPANLHRVRGSVLGSWAARGGTYTLPDYPALTGVPAVAAAFVMIRRDLFLDLGGFDERFFTFMEDTDLSLRLDRSGHCNLFDPSAGAVHVWGHGSSAGPLRRAALHHVSAWKYFRKHHPGLFSRLLLPLLLAANLSGTLALRQLGRLRRGRSRG